MAIKYGKGLRGALGRMPDVGYGYVPLPYKEMLTGNLMRQAAYDKGQETIDNIDSLYDQPVLSDDQDILQAQEDQFDSDLKEQMDAVGGDLGKLTGFLNSRFKQDSRNATYRNALQSKVAYDKYYTELMEADIDPQIKQLKMRQSRANYLGADKGIFQGASYVDMNQIDFDTRMREIAEAVPLTKTTRQIPVYVNKKTGIKYTKYDDAGYYALKDDGTKEYATNANSEVVPQEITTEQKDPRQLAILLNNAINRSGIDSAYVRDLVQAQIPDRQITPEDIQNFIYSEKEDAEGNPYLDGLASQYANESKVSNYDEGTYELSTDSTPTFTPTISSDLDQSFIGDSPVLPIKGETVEGIGNEVINLDTDIAALDILIKDNPSVTPNLEGTNEYEREKLITTRTSKLLQAKESAEKTITRYAQNSIFWNDDTFNKNLKANFEAVENNIPNVNQKEFTEKAKLLAVVPGIESIPLLADSPDAIEALMGLSSANYKLLEDKFTEGESIMPYLKAAKYIANRTRRAGVLATYEKSLRPIYDPKEDSFVSTAIDGLSEMAASNQIAFIDFYSNEDIKAKYKKVEKELLEVIPTTTMIDGVPAYQLNLYESRENKTTSGVTVKRGEIKETTFVKGTNPENELVRYETLGVNLLKRGYEQSDSPTGKQYMREGQQMIANTHVLSPIQSTGIETLPITGDLKNDDGKPYIEKAVPGFNMVVRRVELGPGVSMFELRSKDGDVIGYNDSRTGKPEALVSSSLEDLVYKYFTQSDEQAVPGQTGAQLINHYLTGK